MKVEANLSQKAPDAGFDTKKPSWMRSGSCGSGWLRASRRAFDWVDGTDLILTCHVVDSMRRAVLLPSRLCELG